MLLDGRHFVPVLWHLAKRLDIELWYVAQTVHLLLMLWCTVEKLVNEAGIMSHVRLFLLKHIDIRSR